MYESGAYTSALAFLEEVNRMEHQEVNLVTRVKTLEATVAQLESRLNAMGAFEVERENYRRLLSKSRGIIQDLATENRMLRELLTAVQHTGNFCSQNQDTELGLTPPPPPLGR
jgi:hypothetical protein